MLFQIGLQQGGLPLKVLHLLNAAACQGLIAALQRGEVRVQALQTLHAERVGARSTLSS